MSSLGTPQPSLDEWRHDRLAMDDIIESAIDVADALNAGSTAKSCDGFSTSGMLRMLSTFRLRRFCNKTKAYDSRYSQLMFCQGRGPGEE